MLIREWSRLICGFCLRGKEIETAARVDLKVGAAGMALMFMLPNVVAEFLAAWKKQSRLL